jgi:hypothetical protein
MTILLSSEELQEKQEVKKNNYLTRSHISILPLSPNV